MPNYFDKVEKDLDYKHIANVDDVNLIQSNIEAAFVQTITDNLGSAYVLSEEEDAFKLNPIEDTTNDIIDQKCITGSAWQDIQDLYVLQKIPLTKSSVEDITIRLKNDSVTTDITVNFELLDGNLELLSSYTIVIPANTPNTEYQLSFAEHHLPIDNVFLEIKRTNVAGVSVLYDNAGPYQSGMCTSPTGSMNEETWDWEPINGDLYFVQTYATQSTFNIVGGIAVIQGDKIHNVDSHVTIPPASAFGDRIDVVVMDRDGTFGVVEGEASTEPDEPIVDEGRLIIAYVYVDKNQPIASLMEVDQDETLGRTKLRSLNQRVWNLEREGYWRRNHDIPERIKYNLSGTSLIGSGSTNMTWDGDLSAYRMTSNEIVRSQWTFGSDANITTYNVDHSDHTNGTIKLSTTSYTYEEFYSGHRNTSRKVYKQQCKVYRNKSRVSRYPGGFFNVTHTRKLVRIGLDLQVFKNINRGKLIVFKRSGKNMTHFEDSAWVNANQFDLRQWTMTNFTFSNTKWLTPGDYAFIFMPEPKYTSSTSPAILYPATYYSYDKSINNNTYGEWIGWYPATIPATDTGSYRYGVTLNNRPGRSIGFQVVSEAPGYVTSGYIQSTPVATNSGVASVSVDMNLNIPSETYYKLEVSNDGGVSFYQMTDTNYTFSSQSGQSFVWKLTLNTNNTSKSPQIYYSSTKQYAIKFTLTLAAGSPPTSGQLISATFDGPRIVQYGLGYAQNVTDSVVVDRFSRFEWLRLWCSENAGTISVDFEGSDDGSTWNIVKTGVNLTEIGQSPTMYGETVDPDEYNYNAVVNMNVLTDQEVVEPCETAWTSDDATNVTCTADGTYKVEGSYSAKMALGANATTGLIAHKARNASLVNYDTIQITVRGSKAFDAGDFKFLIGGNEECTDILESFDIPATTLETLTTYEFKLNDPSLLSQVKSFGLEQVEDQGAIDIWIDSIKAMTLGLRMLENCDTAWSNDKPSNITITLENGASYKKEGSYSNKWVVGSDPGTGLLVHKAKTPTLDLTDMKQIRFWIYSTSNIAYGDLQFLIGSNTACTTILEAHNIPAFAANGWVRVTFDLDDPSLLGDVASFGVQLSQASYTTGTFYVDAIEGLATESMPFYQKYVRFRINMTRTLGTDVSPVVHKLGIIPRFI